MALDRGTKVAKKIKFVIQKDVTKSFIAALCILNAILIDQCQVQGRLVVFYPDF
jgi:hypothetical protein